MSWTMVDESMPPKESADGNVGDHPEGDGVAEQPIELIDASASEPLKGFSSARCTTSLTTQ